MKYAQYLSNARTTFTRYAEGNPNWIPSSDDLIFILGKETKWSHSQRVKVVQDLIKTDTIFLNPRKAKDFIDKLVDPNYFEKLLKF